MRCVVYSLSVCSSSTNFTSCMIACASWNLSIVYFAFAFVYVTHYSLWLLNMIRLFKSADHRRWSGIVCCSAQLFSCWPVAVVVAVFLFIEWNNTAWRILNSAIKLVLLLEQRNGIAIYNHFMKHQPEHNRNNTNLSVVAHCFWVVCRSNCLCELIHWGTYHVFAVFSLWLL